jgi:hypothetical protein
MDIDELPEAIIKPAIIVLNRGKSGKQAKQSGSFRTLFGAAAREQHKAPAHDALDL